MEKLTEQLTELLENMDTAELIYLHNEYCSATNGFDDTIYDMDEFDEVMSGQSPEWIACRVYYGDFNPGAAEYFKFNGYGNLVGLYAFDLAEHIYISDIVGYIVDNMDCLYNDDVQEILDEWQAIENRDELEETV
jgi:hypothetical protein